MYIFAVGVCLYLAEKKCIHVCLAIISLCSVCQGRSHRLTIGGGKLLSFAESTHDLTAVQSPFYLLAIRQTDESLFIKIKKRAK